MPLSTGHGLAGLVTAYYFKKDRLGLREAVLCILAANLPDIDYFPGFVIGDPKRFHPSLTHSFFAAAVFTLLVFWGTKYLSPEKRKRWTWMLGVAYISHIVLDIIQPDTYLANGVGVPLFFPFTGQCYQTGWDLFPNLPPIIDWSSFSSLLKSIMKMDIVRYIFQEQLVVGAIAGVVFGLRRFYYYYNKVSSNNSGITSRSLSDSG